MATRTKDLRKTDESAALEGLATLIKDRSGLNLTKEKFVLIETRLRARLTELQLKSFDAYLEILKSDESEIQACIEYLTTHKTEWFREIVHFQWLKKFIHSRSNKSEPLRIWSAACSKGPEVYSLMLLCLKEGLHHNQFRILGTDISNKILNEAKILGSSEETQFQIERALRSLKNQDSCLGEAQTALIQSIKFRPLNIVDERLPTGMKFDVIFLRNVLIYFDKETIIRACRNLGQNLRPGGYLTIGVTETLPQELKEFRPVGDSIYVFEPELRRAG